jgi:hypothetical protein
VLHGSHRASRSNTLFSGGAPASRPVVPHVIHPRAPAAFLLMYVIRLSLDSEPANRVRDVDVLNVGHAG